MWAASSSVGPPASIGSPPRPSATSMTIFDSFLVCNSRVSSWMSMTGFLKFSISRFQFLQVTSLALWGVRGAAEMPNVTDGIRQFAWSD